MTSTKKKEQRLYFRERYIYGVSGVNAEVTLRVAEWSSHFCNDIVSSVEVKLIERMYGFQFADVAANIVAQFYGLKQFETHGRYLESTNDDAFWVPSSNDTYVPSENVKNGHMLTGMKFSLSQEYLTKLLTLPILFLALGLVSWLFTIIGFICRCCCKICKCLPKVRGETDEEKAHGVKTQKQGWTILFFTLVLFVLIADFLCYYGYNYIDVGVNAFYSAMQQLANIVASMAGASNTINVVDVAGMQTLVTPTKASCCTNPSTTALCEEQISLISNTLPLLGSASSTIYSMVNPFTAILSSFIDLTKQYLFDNRKMAIFVIFAIALLDVILLVIAQLVQSRKFMKFAIFCGMTFFALMVILCCPFMIFTSLFADICMNPSKSLARQVTGSTRELMVFYTTCKGEDSIRDSFSKASSSFDTIGTALDTLKSTYCPSDSNLAAYIAFNADVKTQLNVIQKQISCPTLKSVLLEFINVSLCGGIYSGIYSICALLCVSVYLHLLFSFGTVPSLTPSFSRPSLLFHRDFPAHNFLLPVDAAHYCQHPLPILPIRLLQNPRWRRGARGGVWRKDGASCLRSRNGHRDGALRQRPAQQRYGAQGAANDDGRGGRERGRGIWEPRAASSIKVKIVLRVCNLLISITNFRRLGHLRMRWVRGWRP